MLRDTLMSLSIMNKSIVHMRHVRIYAKRFPFTVRERKPFQHSQRANPEVSKRFFQAFPIILHVLFELAALKQNQDYLVFN